mgnify:CR=1 FL=1
MADYVLDALEAPATTLYGTVACCSVDQSPDFTAAKDSLHLAIICEVAPASKTHHAADLYIGAMELVAQEQKNQTIEMVKQLQRVSNISQDNPATSPLAAWQRKCRRLQRYPTSQA